MADTQFAVFSRGLMAQPTLPALIGGQLALTRGRVAAGTHAVLGWGRRPRGEVARRAAQRQGLPFWCIEDGFLRSWNAGSEHPPLSVVVDTEGIYYDSTQSSQLERLLQSDTDVLAGHVDAVASAKALLLQHGLSKYNNAPVLETLDPPLGAGALRDGDRARVLVVDQTAGDLSVTLGQADTSTFDAMLAAALAENPEATIYVKTHPETSAGRKGGYLSQVQPSGRVVLLRDPIQPLSLLRQMNHVYVVTSTLGFEALLAGKTVTCFGLPWYAGWGVTDDRQHCPRRITRRTVDELFAAAYLHYTRYLDPHTHTRGTLFDVVGWLARQSERANVSLRPAIAVGFPKWRRHHLAPLLCVNAGSMAFAADAGKAQASNPGPAADLVIWGATPPHGVAALAQRTGARLVRMEDGFIRSVGLGSDLVRPHSLVLDPVGLYFDPSAPSGLENILNTAGFDAAELAEAVRVREFIVAHGLTKYNHEPRGVAVWPHARRLVVLVPGQVEDDASIHLGCTMVRTNVGLLAAVRAARPDAFIVYKPHPDVTSGNRKGRVALAEARRWADHVESHLSVVSCIEACDELHTMTSLAGFDALLRGKHVVTYGQPFYAGWGLTTDTVQGGVALARRTRRLTLDEMVAGTLLRYPIYWDWTLKGYTTCMAVLRTLAAERDAMERAGTLQRLRTGWIRRQLRKARVLVEAWKQR